VMSVRVHATFLPSLLDFKLLNARKEVLIGTAVNKEVLLPRNREGMVTRSNLFDGVIMFEMRTLQKTKDRGKIAQKERRPG